MECAEIKSHLSEYLDGVLDTKTINLVEKHIVTCGECKKTLESLQLLVHELSDFESVKAPDDFLEQLYDRMEKRTTLQNLKRRLLVPFRIKIPLQVAATAAMAVLIFFVIHTPKIEKKLSHSRKPEAIRDVSKESDAKTIVDASHEKEMPALAVAPETSSPIGPKTEEHFAGAPLEPERFASKSKKFEAKPSFHGKASVQEPATHKAEPEPSLKGTVKVVELVLLLESKASMGDHTPQLENEMKDFPALREKRTREMNAPDIPKSQTRSMGDDRDENIGYLAGEVPKTKDEYILNVLSRDEILSRVIDLVGYAKGTVLSTKYDQDTNLPDFLDAEIPTGQYGFFFEKIQQVGTLQTPTPDVDLSGHEHLRIRIHFTQSHQR